MPVKLTEYCTRGSLGDLLESDDFVLDFDFSLSFISDLIKVSVFANSRSFKIKISKISRRMRLLLCWFLFLYLGSSLS